MKILLIRHASAEPQDPERDDSARALTPRGARRWRRAVRGLTRVVEAPDVLLTSPWRRARETAEIAAVAFQCAAPIETEALTGAPFESLVAAIAEAGSPEVVALVGHEPWISELLARLTNGSAERMGFRKGGVALVDCPAGASAGGRLVSFLPPRVLRRLGS
jgi:phosphohistidine phosphatase